MKNLLKPLAECFLIPLGMTAAASTTESAIQKKIFGTCMRSSDLAKWTTLIIWNEEIDDITKIIKSLGDSGSLIKGISKTNENEAKENTFRLAIRYIRD